MSNHGVTEQVTVFKQDRFYGYLKAYPKLWQVFGTSSLPYVMDILVPMYIDILSVCGIYWKPWNHDEEDDDLILKGLQENMLFRILYIFNHLQGKSLCPFFRNNVLWYDPWRIIYYNFCRFCFSNQRNIFPIMERKFMYGMYYSIHSGSVEKKISFDIIIFVGFIFASKKHLSHYACVYMECIILFILVQ